MTRGHGNPERILHLTPAEQKIANHAAGYNLSKQNWKDPKFVALIDGKLKHHRDVLEGVVAEFNKSRLGEKV
ncbi:hypothetical protein PDO_5226 [Rhizobium sp. PDO1-076]|nr:hypothetical protein PDO_5226 [Rhizobium sp. PDO1-076]